MVSVICHFSGYRPEIHMYVEKVHIDRYLDAFAFYIFLFVDLLDYHDFSIRHGCHDILPFRSMPLRDPEKEEDEYHEEYQNGGYRIGDELVRNKMQAEIYQQPAEEPYCGYSSKTILMYSHIPRIKLQNYKKSLTL